MMIRTPEVYVTANDVPIRAVSDVEVQSNNYLGADRFRISSVLDPTDYEIWTSSAIEIVISVGLDGTWQELIRGFVDRIEVDVSGGLVHVDGRDLTARFIDARIQETFENRTASEVALLLAERRGLVPSVSPTTTLVGRYYGGDHSRVTLDQYSAMTTEWDLLTKLASNEGFDVWVDGQTLNFAPPSDGPSPIIVRPSDCQSLRLDRALALGTSLSVTVKSWDCRAHTSVSQVAGIQGGASGQNYIVIKPNLTELEAASLAKQVLAQMLQNARIITFDWPGELAVRPRQTLILADSGTDFDGPYIVTSVERRLSFRQGFTETLQGRTPPWTIS